LEEAWRNRPVVVDDAATGVDRISIGRLTKDLHAVDYSMRVQSPV